MKRILAILVTLLFSSIACSLGTSVTPASDSAQPTPLPANEDASQPSPMPPANEPPVATVNACDNIYMPVIPGATWTYSLVGQVSDTYTHTILSRDDTSFVEQDAFASGVTRKGDWACADGNLTALTPTGGASVNTNGLTSEFVTTTNTGITFPANPQPGSTWSQFVILEGTQTINGFTANSRNQVETTCTVIGMEAVSVPAGTFEALRVECAVQMLITATVEGTSFDTNLSSITTSWYAPKVGMVKSATVGGGLDSTTELTSYSLP